MENIDEQIELIKSERLQAIAAMASGLAHDLNNALSPILGYSEIFMIRPEQLQQTNKVEKALREIHSAAKHAAQVIRKLREFYRLRDSREVYLPLNIRELLEEAVLLSKHDWKKDSLSLALDELPVSSGNRVELLEVFRNLIQNAKEAMPNGGTLKIEGFAAQGTITLRFIDTGIGMSESIRSRCIEPFFTTKSELGSGLGLSVVHGIIRRHEGKMKIQSQPNVGSTITIELPVITTEPQNNIKPDESTQGLMRSLHILLVEDEPQVRDVTVEFLVSEGHTVETATNGREGLERFYHGQFDLVITDNAMPEISGDKMAFAIKQHAPKKPILMITALADAHLSNSSGGAVDLVVYKPISLGDLQKAISDVMNLKS